MTSEEINRIIEEGLPPAPDNVTEWIYDECVEPAFLLYRGNRAVCTRCGEEWEIEPGSFRGSHGFHAWCPCCDREVTCMEGGRGRNKYRDTFRIVIYVSSGRTVWASYWYIDADFKPFGRPELKRSLAAIYRMDSEKQDYFKSTYNWYFGKRTWKRIKEVRIPGVPRGGYFGWYSNPKYDRIYAYPYNMADAFKDTDAKYLVQQEAMKELVSGIENFHRYLALGLKYKSIELLMKSGFDNLANSKIRGYGSGAINIRGGDLRKILRLPDRWIKKIRPWNPTNSELKHFQKLDEKEKEIITRPLLKDVCDYYSAYNDSIEVKLIKYRASIEEYAPFLKWLKYIAGQPWAKEEKKGGSTIRSDYLDYIKTAENLGMDITKKKILYPPDLKEAHDRIMQMYKAEENKIRDAAITMYARSIEYQINDLMILPALTQEDLNQESAKLCHCVKTYGEKLEKGKCWIFFIRHAESPNEPYYTLETDISGRFIQCRGLHNCSMTDEVKAFTDGFIKKLILEVRNERKEKGLLCQTV